VSLWRDRFAARAEYQEAVDIARALTKACADTFLSPDLHGLEHRHCTAQRT
jgi:hypothetical protein